MIFDRHTENKSISIPTVKSKSFSIHTWKSCLLAFVPCFLLSFFVFPFFLFLFFVFPASRYVYLLCCAAAICYSQQVRIYNKCYFCLLCHLYPTPSRNFLSFICLAFFFVPLISWVAFFLLCSRTRYASTWFTYLEPVAFGFSLSHRLWPHNLYLSRKENQEGHWGYCWCRWVERTV